MTLKSKAYTDTPLDYQLLLGGQDISDAVADIPSISKSVDTDEFAEYRVGEMVVILNDPAGFYTSTRADNFFVGQGKAQSGQGVSVVLKLGYVGDMLEDYFVGRVIDIFQEVEAEISFTNIVCSDRFHELFTTPIVDFGHDKHFRLVLDETEDALNGVYPLPDFVRPVSDGSTEVSKSVIETLDEVPVLATRGPVGEGNYTVTETAIETEGGPIAEPATGYPQVRLKSPYRWTPAKVIVEKILTHIGITDRDIVEPTLETEAHFSSLGRVGYEIVAQSVFGSSNPATWQGYPTDALFDSGVFYFLYSVPRGTIGSRSMLIQYEADSDEWTLLWRAPVIPTALTEVWKMAKNGDDLAILATDGSFVFGDETTLQDIPTPRTGSYNCAESGNSVYLLKRDVTTPHTDTTVIQLVHKNSPIKAQLAHRYLLGSTYSDFSSIDVGSSLPVQRPPVMLPDSRRRLVWHNNELYFVGANETHVGVAKVGSGGGTPAWVENIARDQQGNEAGLHFDMIGNRVFLCNNFKKASASSGLAWSKDV